MTAQHIGRADIGYMGEVSAMKRHPIYNVETYTIHTLSEFIEASKTIGCEGFRDRRGFYVCVIKAKGEFMRVDARYHTQTDILWVEVFNQTKTIVIKFVKPKKFSIAIDEMEMRCVEGGIDFKGYSDDIVVVGMNSEKEIIIENTPPM